MLLSPNARYPAMRASQWSHCRKPASDSGKGNCLDCVGRQLQRDAKTGKLALVGTKTGRAGETSRLPGTPSCRPIRKTWRPILPGNGVCCHVSVFHDLRYSAATLLRTRVLDTYSYGGPGLKCEAADKNGCHSGACSQRGFRGAAHRA